MGTTIGTVASLHRFPVKSMQGEALDRVEVTANGIVGDRQWALRDAETGKLVSAKRPRLWRTVLDCRAVDDDHGDVVVTLPSGESFPIDDPALSLSLGALLGREITIEAATRAQQGVYESDWPEIDGISLSGEIDLPTNLTGEGTTFVDLGILHVLTTTSLATLQAAAPDVVVDVRRFRPGLVFDTPDLDGFPENDWVGRSLTVGGATITMGDPAPRCIMTTVAQEDLPGQPGVLQAIARVNRLSNPMGTFACLGAYASVEGPGTIAVGDELVLD